MHGSPVALTLTGGNSYSWAYNPPGNGITNSGTGSGTTAVINDVLANPDHNTAFNATYNVVTTKTSGALSCSSLGTGDVVTITVNPTPTLTSATSKTICSGLPVALALTGGNSYSWTFVPGSSGITGGIPSAQGISSTINDVLTSPSHSTPLSATYNVITTKAFGAFNCSSLGTPGDVVTVTVNPAPNLTNNFPSSICSGSAPSVNLNSSLGTNSTFTWAALAPSAPIAGLSTSSGTGSVINQPVITNNSDSTYGTVRYVVTITSNATTCSNFSRDTVTVKVNPKPMVRNMVNPTICSGLSPNITLIASDTTSNFAWTSVANNVTSNQAANGTGSIIGAVLYTPSTNQGTDTFKITPTSLAGCTGPTKNIIVTVNPQPIITAPAAGSYFPQCNGDTLSILLTNIQGVPAQFSWIANPQPGSSVVHPGPYGGTLNDVVFNSSSTTPRQIDFTILDTSTAGGCGATPVTIHVTVNPTPVFTVTTDTICSKQLTNIDLKAHTSTGAGLWKYSVAAPASITGFDSTHGSFLPDSVIKQALTNSSDTLGGLVTYTIIPQSLAGCKGAPADYKVYVNPLPTLKSPTTQIICSDSVLIYNVRASTGTGSQYIWTKSGFYGSPSPTSYVSTGTPIIDTLRTHFLLDTASVVYNFTLKSASGCFSPADQKLTVLINPTPDTPGISLYPKTGICSGEIALNFRTSRNTLPLTGGSKEKFTWSVAPSGFVAQASDSLHREYALISFPTPGIQTVSVVSTVAGFTCKSKPSTVQITVGNSPNSSNPTVVKFDKSFVCLTGSTGSIASYQWGYDNRATLKPDTLQGATSQSYLFPNGNMPDTLTNAYWVFAMYSGDGCIRKAYYNRPGSLDVPTVQSAGSAIPVKVYPNPARGTLYVELPAAWPQVIIELTDLTGRRLMQANATAARTGFNIDDLAPGCYLISCWKDGVRIATSRFIKN